MTTTVSLRKSHDVGYFSAGHAPTAVPRSWPMTPDPANCQVSGIGTGLVSWRRPARSAPTRRTVHTRRRWRSSGSVRSAGEIRAEVVPGGERLAADLRPQRRLLALQAGATRFHGKGLRCTSLQGLRAARFFYPVFYPKWLKRRTGMLYLLVNASRRPLPQFSGIFQAPTLRPSQG